MQEAPAAHETFAGVLAIDDVVDRGEIGFAVALAALRRGVLPGAGSARSARARASPDATTGNPARADRARSCRPSAPRCAPSRPGSAPRHRDRNWARAEMPTPMPSASNSCAREKLAIVSLVLASASAVRSGSLLMSVTTRVTTAACRAWSSRIEACFASTCAISWLSTEDNSEVSLASAIRPRVT